MTSLRSLIFSVCVNISVRCPGVHPREFCVCRPERWNISSNCVLDWPFGRSVPVNRRFFHLRPRYFAPLTWKMMKYIVNASSPMTTLWVVKNLLGYTDFPVADPGGGGVQGPKVGPPLGRPPLFACRPKMDPSGGSRVCVCDRGDDPASPLECG